MVSKRNLQEQIKDLQYSVIKIRWDIILDKAKIRLAELGYDIEKGNGYDGYYYNISKNNILLYSIEECDCPKLNRAINMIEDFERASKKKK